MKNSYGLVKSEFDNILPSMELILLVMDARVPDVLEETRRQRCLRITLLLYELKSELDRLQNALDSGKESDLLGMVNYALKKYSVTSTVSSRFRPVTALKHLFYSYLIGIW